MEPLFYDLSPKELRRLAIEFAEVNGFSHPFRKNGKWLVETACTIS
jgi:hypothetical protein